MDYRIREVGDAERGRRWLLARVAATQMRAWLDFRSVRPSRRVGLVLMVVLVVLLSSTWLTVGLLLGLVALVVDSIPDARRLKRGRVWEAYTAPAAGAEHLYAWAVATPHELDRLTWRLDVVLRPGRALDLRGLGLLLQRVHDAADVFGVAIQSIDPADGDLLSHFDYVQVLTPAERHPLRHRWARAVTAVPGPASQICRARFELSSVKADKSLVAPLVTAVLQHAETILADTSEADWDHTVLRRSTPVWELARCCALCMDAIVENVAIGRLDPASIPGGWDKLDSQLRELAEFLRRSAARLPDEIMAATARFAIEQGQPLAWPQELAAIEVDSLQLSGMVAMGRWGESVSLGILEPEAQTKIEGVATAVLQRARTARSSTLFDADGVTWWSLAIAADALDLCGRRRPRATLHKAIRQLELHSLRTMSVVAESDQTAVSWGAGDPGVIEFDKVWTALLASPPPREFQLPLAALSATRPRRIGVTRGSEGLRQMRFRRAINELGTSLLFQVFAGAIVWFVIAAAVHPSMAWFNPLLGSDTGGTASEAVGTVTSRVLPDPPTRPSFNLGVSTERAWTGTLALLAVVITGAVAVAVASPRESSTRTWSRDRAWQVFVVAVGHVCSIAGLVLVLSPLPFLSTYDSPQRAELCAAGLFALLTASGAASTSALRSRLDDWQQRRRLSLATVRLRRAHERLGVPPRLPVLVLQAVRCTCICLAPCCTLFALLFRAAGPMYPEDWWLLLGLTLLNLPPMGLVLTFFVINWARTWGLAGRVAISLSVLCVILLLVYLAYMVISLVRIGDVDWVVLSVLLIFVSPILTIVVLLVWARRSASLANLRTGPATFALHLSHRFGRWNYSRMVG